VPEKSAVPFPRAGSQHVSLTPKLGRTPFQYINPLWNHEDATAMERFYRAIARMREAEERWDLARAKAYRIKRRVYEDRLANEPKDAKVQERPQIDPGALLKQVERMLQSYQPFLDQVGDINKYQGWMQAYACIAQAEWLAWSLENGQPPGAKAPMGGTEVP